jgi:hypothetical protein
MANFVNKLTLCVTGTSSSSLVSNTERGLRALLLVAATAGLLACQPTVTPTTTAAPVIKASASAGPGSNSISAARARSVFASLCVNQRGSRSGTETAAAADGFIKNTTYGTYYHPRDNLSVKLIDGDCSMVFASTASPAELQKALTSLTSGTPAVRFAPSVSLDSTPYYNVRIAAR